MNDGSDGAISADSMLVSARGLLDPVHLRQHQISNEIVEVDGDLATVTFYEQALHHHPALGDDPAVNTWVVHGRGDPPLASVPRRLEARLSHLGRGAQQR